MGYGERIREIREQKGLTLTELADRLDIDKSTLSKIERNLKTLSFAMAQALAKELQVNLICFIKGE